MKIGFLDTYYGFKSPEQENMLRYKEVFEDLGHEFYFLTKDGFLQSDQSRHVDNENFDLILCTDNSVEGMEYIPDCFTIFINWCPTGYLSYLRFRDYAKRQVSFDVNIVSCLNYEHEQLVNNFTDNKFLSTENLSVFPTVCEKYAISPRYNENYKIFYIGINKDSGAKKGRHYYVLKGLEEKGILNLYGPKFANGDSCWRGFSSYIDEIPFDGKSVVKEISNAGVCLALHSSIHNESGNITNRIFEACAAGAVIITDDNEYTRKFLGDSVYYVDINKNETELLQDVISIYDHIKLNPEEALQKAQSAQRVFFDKWTLEKSVSNLLEVFKTRMAEIQDKSKQLHQIDIVAYVDKKEDISNIIEQINKQYYKNIKIYFSIRHELVSDLNIKLSDCDIDYMLFETNESSRGKRFCQIKDSLTGEYFVFVDGTSDLQSRALVKLSDCITSRNTLYSYCGTYVKNIADKKIISYETINKDEIYAKEFFIPFITDTLNQENYVLEKKLIQSCFDLEEKYALSSVIFSKKVLNITNNVEISNFNNAPHIYFSILSMLKARDYGTFCMSVSVGYKKDEYTSNLIFGKNYNAYLNADSYLDWKRCNGLTIKDIYTTFAKYSPSSLFDSKYDFLEEESKKYVFKLILFRNNVQICLFRIIKFFTKSKWMKSKVRLLKEYNQLILKRLKEGKCL